MQLVVDAGVKAQLFHGIFAFVGATGNADRAATARLAQGGKGTANRAGGGTHHHGLTGLRRNDLDQPVPGGHPRHADCAQVGTERHMGGVDLAHRANQVAVDHAVFLPAAHTHHFVAHGVFGVARFHHLTHGAALHGLPQRLGLGVTLGVVHATAHVRVQAQKVVPHQHLTILQWRCLCGDEFEVAGNGFPDGAVVQKDLLVGWHGGVFH